MRKLGIPVVMDRIVGVSMHLVLEAIFDADFTGSNFGFRRGKSQHQAIPPTRFAFRRQNKDCWHYLDDVQYDLGPLRCGRSLKLAM